MACTYRPEIREAACRRMLDGERVEDLASGLGISAATLYRWKRQALIDAGRRPGIKSYEPDELARAKRRIKDLEHELELVKAASALFNEEEVIRPKGSAGLSRSTFHYQQVRHPSTREVRRILLADTIKEIHLSSRSTYGVRRIRAALRFERGLVVNTKLVRRIMAEQGICGLPRRRRNRRNLVNVATNEDLVNRNFSATGPNALWLTDITEHKTREGTLYCYVVLDQYSRRAGPSTGATRRPWSTTP